MNRVKEYLETSQMQTRDNITLMNEFKDEISKMHGRCIDIGCGPATFTRQYILPKLPDCATIMGCDVTHKMIEYAKEVNADEKRLSFMALDLQTEHLPQNQIGIYDNALSFFCIHWCHNIRKAFENIHQLLRPGGKALVLFLAEHLFCDSIAKLKKYPKYAPFIKELSMYIPPFQHWNDTETMLTMTEILENCDFKIIHCSVRSKTYTYENVQVVKTMIRSMNPLVGKMPDNMMDEFENDLLQEVVKIVRGLNNSDRDPEVFQAQYKVVVAYVEKNKN